MANLTNNKPKDTYPRLVQIEQGRFQNGLGELITGSIVALHVSNSLQVDGNTDIAGDLVVTGSIRAREFITTTVSSSVLLQSGSTLSGNSLDDTHTFTGSLNLSGSLLVTGSMLGFKVHKIDLPEIGTDILVSDSRTTLRAKASGSGIFANVSVEDNGSGKSLVKMYGDTVLIGAYTGSVISFGNINTTTYFQGTNIIQGDTQIFPGKIFRLQPSTTLPTALTGSLVVSGSSFGYYDGTKWEFMQTGSFALLADHLIATASISVNETNISTLTSKTGSYALTSSLNVATASITVNETNINTLTAATSSYALKTAVSGAFDNSGLNDHTGSLNTFSGSIQTEVNSLQAATSSYQLKLTSASPVQATYLIPAFFSGSAGVSYLLTGSSYDNASIVKLDFTGSVNGTATCLLPDATLNQHKYRSIRLFTSSSVDNQKIFKVKPSGSQLLDGDNAGQDLNRSYEGIMVWSDGTEWYKIQAKNV